MSKEDEVKAEITEALKPLDPEAQARVLNSVHNNELKRGVSETARKFTEEELKQLVAAEFKLNDPNGQLDIDKAKKFLHTATLAELHVGGPQHYEHARWLMKNSVLAGGLIARSVRDSPISGALKKSVLHDLVTFTGGTIVWATSGFPVFNLTLDFFRALLVTDFGDAGTDLMQMPFHAFLIRCPEPLHGETKNLFIYPVSKEMPDGSEQLTGTMRMTLEASESSAHRQAFTQWSSGMTFGQFLGGPVRSMESLDAVEAAATLEMGTTMDPNATAIARRVLGNLLLYINANGGLPTEKRLGPAVAVEREHRSEPRFRVGRPIKLGPQIRAALSYARDRSDPKWKLMQRFVVRGHWKNQVHGAGRALRKRVWIQMYWKGPENINEALERTFEVE